MLHWFFAGLIAVSSMLFGGNTHSASTPQQHAMATVPTPTPSPVSGGHDSGTGTSGGGTGSARCGFGGMVDASGDCWYGGGLKF